MDISRELLQEILNRIERDWDQIDSEWGPSVGGLDGEIERGSELLIPKLRSLLLQPKEQVKPNEAST